MLIYKVAMLEERRHKNLAAFSSFFNTDHFIMKNNNTSKAPPCICRQAESFVLLLIRGAE